MEPPAPSGDRLCVVYGHSLPAGLQLVQGQEVTAADGAVRAIDAGSLVALPRHGLKREIPAHLVDHHANVRAICELGCDRVLALGSAGSLRPEALPVGTLACPDDFLALGIAPSFYEDPRGHTVPGFQPEWRGRVVEAFAAQSKAPFVADAVYAQTRGPRFETPTEVRALARDADLVGMTLAAEIVLAGEAGLAHAALCTVDNVANGLEDEPLTPHRYREGRERTARGLVAALEQALPALAEAPR